MSSSTSRRSSSTRSDVRRTSSRAWRRSSRSARRLSRAPSRPLPALRRPDGAEIHWEERGAGPAVIFAPHAVAFPAVYSGLLDELARDLRVVTYDPRGAGQSSRVPPAGFEDDVGDLQAVLAELRDPAVAVVLGDASMRAAAVAVAHAEVIPAVVVVGASSVPPRTLARAQAPVSSPGVIEALLELAENNPRAAIRALLELTNPGMSTAALRERLDASLAYCSAQAIRDRNRWYYADESAADLRKLGDRLWIVRWESEWSPGEVIDELRELLPESHIETVAEGAISRPDLTAEIVRRAVAPS